jgi:hypothetical protein
MERDSGAADSRFEESTSLLSRYTDMVSSSISPLSYNFTWISLVRTVSVCISSLERERVIAGSAMRGFGVSRLGASISTGALVMRFTVSVCGFGFATAVSFLPAVFWW